MAFASFSSKFIGNEINPLRRGKRKKRKTVVFFLLFVRLSTPSFNEMFCN